MTLFMFMFGFQTKGRRLLLKSDFWYAKVWKNKCAY